nr:EGF-like repeat and discoidin I-like domain-containing protein 3 [Lytechinus pictus]
MYFSAYKLLDVIQTIYFLSIFRSTIAACLSNPCLYGGTCEETEIGFSCLCFDGYHGNRCENELVLSVKLLGDNISEGPLALTSRPRPNTHFLIHQHQWNMKLSQLACQYLGFEGVFATVSGALYDSIDPPSEVVSVVCPDDVMNITECWYETRVGGINESETIAVICCPVNSCNVSGRPLGLESGALPDSAISESECFDTNLHCARHGRLNHNGAWSPVNRNEYQWMQVQFESSFVITAVTVQGRPDYSHWVTSFVVSSSLDTITWTYYLSVYSASVEVFPGNYDTNSYVTHMFIRPITGQSFRIHPKTFYGRIAMRMELYGFGPVTDVIAELNVEGKPGCRPPMLGEGLGVEDGRIPDSSLTASSFHSAGHEPYRGRLNTPEGPGIAVGAWVAVKTDSNKWVKTSRTDLVNGIDNREQIDVILLDLAKAFDKVPHGRLLNKLDFYGIRNSTHEWIADFLDNRTQVLIEGTKTQVTSGVPQGSVVGPMLFQITCLMTTLLGFSQMTAWSIAR